MCTVSAGHYHSLFLDDEKCVWSCGKNSYGQLGHNDVYNRAQPKKINTLPPVTSISAGELASLFLDDSNHVWGCGKNEHGELGLGDTNQRNNPERINSLPPIKSIAAGGYHSLFLDFEGGVWACGLNKDGQLGMGDTVSKKRAEKISTLPPIRAIASGLNHSMFLDKDGCVWCCGKNCYGQLGVGDVYSKKIPEKIKELPLIKSICALNHSLFLDYEGGVWSCGNNGDGRLGVGDTVNHIQPANIKNIPEITTISGYYHTILLDVDGKVWMCGNNKDGQLGINYRNQITPKLVEGLPTIIGISAGGYHSLLVDLQGSVWSCGNNSDGRLGLGDNINRKVPEKINNFSLLHSKSIEPLMKGKLYQIFTSIHQVNILSPENMTPIMQKLQSNERFVDLKDINTIKQAFLRGEIPMLKWDAKSKEIRKNLNESKLQLEIIDNDLREHQKKLAHLLELVKQTEQQVAEKKEELAAKSAESETWQFFDQFIEPIAIVELELTDSFNAKRNNVEKFSVDDVSLFLGMCGLSQLVPKIQEKKITGEDMMLYSAASGFRELEIEDILLEKQLEYKWKLFENDLLFDNDHLLSQSLLWRHDTVPKTILLLAEYHIPIPSEKINQTGATISQLIFCDASDLKKLFEIDTKTCLNIVIKLKNLKKSFKHFLSSTAKSK